MNGMTGTGNTLVIQALVGIALIVSQAPMFIRTMGVMTLLFALVTAALCFSIGRPLVDREDDA